MRVASTTLGIFGAAGSVSAWATSGRDESAQGGQLQDTLQLLSTFASDSNRQADEAKAGLLKQRLEALKMMLRFASPAQLKKFAQELKQIAGELASLGQQASSGSADPSGAQPVAASVNAALAVGQAQVAPANGGDSGSKVEASSAEAQAASSATSTGEQAAAAADEPAGGATTASAEHKAGTTDGNSALRAILADARRKLAEVLTALKARSRELDSEARRDLHAAESELGKLDKALGEAAIGSVASVAEDALGAFSNWLGTNVDVKV